MNRLEQRVKKLEEAAPQPPCDHGSPVLFKPSDEEIAKAEMDLANCPKCSNPKSGPGARLVIIKGLE